VRISFRRSAIGVLRGFSQSPQILTETVPEEGIATGFQVVTKSPCAVNLTFDTVSHMQLKSVLI
jgi:hypothetical protein